jgi:hypothetical protein
VFVRRAAAIFSAHPAEVVRLRDRRPHAYRDILSHIGRGQFSGRRRRSVADIPPVYGWHREDNTTSSLLDNSVPAAIFALMANGTTPPRLLKSGWKHFPTHQAAVDALSDACVAWGRQKASLPPLEAP